MTKRRYWVQVEGSRIYRTTKAEIRELSQRLADAMGRALQVGFDELPAGKAIAARRNPISFDIPEYAAAQERARRGRLDYLNATKARRLAKSLRDRRPAVVKREERAFKTGKFLVTATGGPKGRFALARPDRRAADALAEAFRAEGYKVTVTAL